jgi:D-alanine-D-alanine ligase
MRPNICKSQEITPARISDEMTQKVSEIAKRAYEVLKMKGFLEANLYW